MAAGPQGRTGRSEKDNVVGSEGPPMHHDDILEECLDIHKQLLQLEQGMHLWFSRVSGVEVAA